MNQKELRKKAEEYIRLEENSVFRGEVETLLSQEKWDELNDLFYTSLNFGTGGLRGVIGGGFNRMNPYMIRKASQGLANYVKATVAHDEPKAAVAYDSRNYSDTFALETALVFCANGIKTYLFKDLRPTPELSFAVRQLKADTGVVITASHNPAEYNGYKVYWSDGAQVVPPHDKGIIQEVNQVSDAISVMTREEAEKQGLLVMIDSEIDDPYVEMIKKELLRPELVQQRGKDMKVVYTPLHGTGAYLVERVLSDMGIEVITVPEQKKPDGDFPTVDFPNPEIESAMKMGLELAKKEGADILIGTDPDSDRVGIAVPEGEDFRLVTGNQLGAILADYVFSTRKELGVLPQKPAFVNTIVTTELQNEIARSYGAETFKVLTGFKYIGEKIRQFESDAQSPTYIFGGEESYGFLAGREVRDKDAIMITALIAEMTLYNVSRGWSVLDHLQDLYQRFGYYEEFLVSKYFKGQSGAAVMESMMKDLRSAPPASFGGLKVTARRDFQDRQVYKETSGKVIEEIELPPSNVIQYVLEDGSLLTVRPSGTEPKIKFYGSCRSAAGVALDIAAGEVGQKINRIKGDVQKRIDAAEKKA